MTAEIFVERNSSIRFERVVVEREWVVGSRIKMGWNRMGEKGGYGNR